MTADQLDLHMHSYYSDDGEYMPADLVARCSERGITVMSITDHNCVRGVPEGEQAALAAGIRFIPGIEIDCTFQDVNLHVLGYGINYRSEDFRSLEKNIDRQGRRASLQMLSATQGLGFHITEDDMAGLSENYYRKDRWTGEMFAEVLLGKPEYKDHPLLSPYRPGGIRSDNPYVNFYWDFYSQGKICYAEITYPPLAETVDVIHRNGGLAVLAHPGANLRERYELLHPILETGLDGIEVFCSYHDTLAAEYFLRKSEEYGLLTTCGSDFHGKTKPAIEVGDTHCTADPVKIMNKLYKML